jgi:hypothetical protein
VTLLDGPKAAPELDDAQLLFQEARQRRRRRRLITGLVIGVVAVALAATFGLALHRSGTSTHPLTGATPVAPAITRSAMSLEFRPVLCKAPALSLTPGRSPSTGALPACSVSSALTAANLAVDTSTGQAVGDPPADPQFSTYASTPSAGAAASDTVLLPGAAEQGSPRFVLGPAALTQTGVASAKAVDEDGRWVVDLGLTPQGSLRWDTLAQQQFHAFIGIVVNGTVISAPITQPAQSSFVSFAGQVQIAAGFTERQAKSLAAGI